MVKFAATISESKYVIGRERIKCLVLNRFMYRWGVGKNGNGRNGNEKNGNGNNGNGKNGKGNKGNGKTGDILLVFKLN